jgi:hypothetical protein
MELQRGGEFRQRTRWRGGLEEALRRKRGTWWVARQNVAWAAGLPRGGVPELQDALWRRDFGHHDVLDYEWSQTKLASCSCAGERCAHLLSVCRRQRPQLVDRSLASAVYSMRGGTGRCLQVVLPAHRRVVMRARSTIGAWQQSLPRSAVPARSVESIVARGFESRQVPLKIACRAARSPGLDTFVLEPQWSQDRTGVRGCESTCSCNSDEPY